MKYIPLFLIACLVFFPGHAQTSDVLTNQTILELKKAGISTATQKSMIASTPCSFVTDTKTIIELKKSGIDDEVIQAMIEKMNAAKVPSVDTSITPLVAKLLKEGSGVYYQTEDSSLLQLEPSVFSQSKQGSGIGSMLTYGLAKTKQKMSVSGSAASLQIQQKKPVLYFVFTTSQSINQQTSDWFASASSPNEFILVKFDKKGKNREIVVGSTNDYSGSVQGIDDKQKIPFRFKKHAKGMYEIQFDTPLEPGEYCFMYAGAMTRGGGNPKVYDFGIK